MDKLIKFALGSKRNELAKAIRENRAIKREAKELQRKIDNKECVTVETNGNCDCYQCSEFYEATELVDGSETKEEAIIRLSSVFSMEKSKEYAEIFDDLMGYPI